MGTYTVTLSSQGNTQTYAGYRQFGPSASTTAYVSHTWSSYNNVYLTGFSFEVYCNSASKWDSGFTFDTQWQLTGNTVLSKQNLVTGFEYSDMTKNGSYRYKCTIKASQFGFSAGFNDGHPIGQNTTLKLYWTASAYAVSSALETLHLGDVTLTFSGDEVIDDGSLKVASTGRTLYVVNSYAVASVTASTSGTYFMKFADYKKYFGFAWGAGDYVQVTLPDKYVAGVTYYTSGQVALKKAD